MTSLFLGLLSDLPLSVAALEEVANWTEMSADDCPKVLKNAGASRDFVVDLDQAARAQARNHNFPEADLLWVKARLTEHLLGEQGRPYCKFCYRIADQRTNGRLKDYCAEHASGGQSGNEGGYLRGRKYWNGYRSALEKIEEGHIAEKVSGLWLRHQLNSLRVGAGNPSFVLIHAGQQEPEWARQSGLSPSDLRVPEIIDNFPDWTEVAFRWRSLFADQAGMEQIASGIPVSPLHLATQWCRWQAWHLHGDSLARQGKGRPARIDKELAARMRQSGKSNREIAEHFGVSEGSVAVSFSRQKKIDPKV